MVSVVFHCSPLNYLYWLLSSSSFSAVKTHAFEMVADRLIILQLAAFLEIAHVLLGWVKGGVLQTIIQVNSAKDIMLKAFLWKVCHLV